MAELSEIGLVITKQKEIPPSKRDETQVTIPELPYELLRGRDPKEVGLFYQSYERAKDSGVLLFLAHLAQEHSNAGDKTVTMELGNPGREVKHPFLILRWGANSVNTIHSDIYRSSGIRVELPSKRKFYLSCTDGKGWQNYGVKNIKSLFVSQHDRIERLRDAIDGAIHSELFKPSLDHRTGKDFWHLTGRTDLGLQTIKIR